MDSQSSDEIEFENDELFVEREACKKRFSSISAKNVHFKSKHKGRRFICSICSEELSSKFSLQRHMERAHPQSKPADIDENEVFISDRVEMSDSAKNALIDRLRKELQEKNLEIKNYKLKIEQLEVQLKNKEKKILHAEYAVAAVHDFIRNCTETIPVLMGKRLEGEFILSFTDEEVNELLSIFIKNLRKPNGGEYAPDTFLYFILGMQKYFLQNGKFLNILFDPSCKGISDSLDEVLSKSLPEFLKKGKNLFHFSDFTNFRIIFSQP